MPAKGKTTLTETQKQTIVALRIQGVSNRVIADKLGLHPITISKVYSDFRREASGVIDDLGDDWKSDVKSLAVRAVKRGLTDESDNHKSGSLGVQALRGLGEFVNGQHIQIDGAVAMKLSWTMPQPAEYQAEELTLDVETKLIGE